MTHSQLKVKSPTGVKNAILKHRKVWLTMDGKSWVYAALRGDGLVVVNYGLSHELVKLHEAMANILDFLSFKRSTDLLGG